MDEQHNLGEPPDGGESAAASTQRIGRNVFALLYTNLGSRGLGFITLLLLAKRLGPAGFGALGYVGAVANILTQIAGQACQAYGIRELAGPADHLDRRRTVWEIGLLNLITALAALLIFIGVGQLLGVTPQRQTVFALWIPILLFSTVSFEWVPVAEERMWVSGNMRILRAILFLGLTLALVHGTSDLAPAIVANITGTGAAWLGLLLYTIVRYRPTGPSVAGMRKHLGAVGYFAASTLFIEIFNEMDTVMLGILRDDFEVGLYSAPYRIVWTIVGFAGLFATAFMPAVARTTKLGQTRQRAIILGVYSKVMAIGAVAALALAIRADSILKLAFSDEYLPGIPAFRILLVVAGVMSLNLSFAHSLLYAGHHRLYLIVMASAATGNVILNFVLIPPFGALGAAVATLAAELTILVLASIFFFRELGSPRYEARVGRRLLAYAAIALGVAWGTGWLDDVPALCLVLLTCLVAPFALGLIRLFPLGGFLSPPEFSDDEAGKLP